MTKTKTVQKTPLSSEALDCLIIGACSLVFATVCLGIFIGHQDMLALAFAVVFLIVTGLAAYEVKRTNRKS